MIHRSRVNSLVLILSLLLVGCQGTVPEANNPNATITQENSVNPQESAERVVALTSLSADIIYQLDKTKLVGIPGSRLMAGDERFQDLPKVSQGQTPPNVEKIVALKPDLVIGAAGFHDAVLKQLEEVGVATQSTEIDSWDGLIALTEEIARAIASDPDPLLERYQTFLADIPESKYSTLTLVSRQPMLAPNKNSWAGDLLSKFQVQNVAAELQGNAPIGGYVTLSPEKVLQSQPEILLIVDTGEGLPEQLKSEPFWQELPATQRDRVYVFDYYGLVNPGSIDKIEEACIKLQEIFSQS
ncbi:ABC transporter substrate-binding protein [Lusitaniella coriacea LEGE 07157]|uniref:ABC transporter substrate-binding protein n=1 Tax=Lusitaniella coriacea LEGE 07157 TaxID=945747 RepID=A0A8J7DYC4_9CYAN|nr:ABC transporter substrate-binding protein [Lusitaniella coriacea]MBE9117714.1 ABC transporter substrate-binding protein [Lusitaniella coriacea LEGE 07157]